MRGSGFANSFNKIVGEIDMGAIFTSPRNTVIAGVVLLGMTEPGKVLRGPAPQLFGVIAILHHSTDSSGLDAQRFMLQ